MPPSLERQNAVTTLRTAAGWLRDTPGLFGVFLLFSLLNAAGQLNVLVSVVGSLLAVAAGGIAHCSAAALVADERPALADHAGTAFERLLSLLVLALAVGIAAGLGAILLILPGIYIGLRLSLTLPACIIDDLGVSGSLAKSWDVAEGNLLKLLGIQVATSGVSVAFFATVIFATGNVDALIQGNQQTLFRLSLATTPITALTGVLGQLAIARVYLENRHGRHTEPEGEAPPENLTVKPGDDEWDEVTSRDAQADETQSVDTDDERS
jgi:hypothetical protein